MVDVFEEEDAMDGFDTMKKIILDKKLRVERRCVAFRIDLHKETVQIHGSLGNNLFNKLNRWWLKIHIWIYF